jgi:hypothetical protein
MDSCVLRRRGAVALKGDDRCAVEAMAPVGAGRNRVILKRTRPVNDAGETVPYP